jgi:hypothetical protein
MYSFSHVLVKYENGNRIHKEDNFLAVIGIAFSLTPCWLKQAKPLPAREGEVRLRERRKR